MRTSRRINAVSSDSEHVDHKPALRSETRTSATVKLVTQAVANRLFRGTVGSSALGG
jgi:hypothetical protein